MGIPDKIAVVNDNLNDKDTGEPLAVMNSPRPSQIRTAAAGGFV